MSLKVKLRLLGIPFILFMCFIWWIPTHFVWSDYQALLHHQNEVRLSLITLWVPIGGLGALIIILIQFPVAMFYGKKINDVFSQKTIKLSNKICIGSAILGIFFAIGFSFYSLNLLNKYGYEYNSKLTKITPTGIHLIYLKKI